MGKLEGKVAFITGAARGQGRSHAIRLAQEGADIIAVDLCSQVASVPYAMATPADLAETVKEVEAFDRRIVATQADVRDYGGLKAALDNGVAQLGKLDIVSANAGIRAAEAQRGPERQARGAARCRGPGAGAGRRSGQGPALTDLAALSSPEAARLADEGALLAVPVASTEQHGAHLPLSTDTDLAVALCARLAESRPGVVVAPPLAYGSSGEHEGFAGTISIGQEAVELVLVELCRSATLTFPRVLLVSTHGGNTEAVRRAERRLRGESRDVYAWLPRWRGDAHAGRTVAALAAAVAETERRWGGLDAALAVAGVIAGGVPAWEVPADQEQAVLDIDLGGVLNLARVAVPALLRRPEPRRGRFLAVASTAATRGLPMLAAFCAAKAGVAGFIRALAVELRGTGITANAVSPGSTATPILDESARLYGLPSAESFAPQQPLGRLLDPAEVAAVLAFLAGDGASGMTGAIVPVDGGLAL